MRETQKATERISKVGVMISAKGTTLCTPKSVYLREGEDGPGEKKKWIETKGEKGQDDAGKREQRRRTKKGITKEEGIKEGYR